MKRTKNNKREWNGSVIRVAEIDKPYIRFLVKKLSLRKPAQAVSSALKIAADSLGFEDGVTSK